MQVVPHDCTTHSKTRGVAILFCKRNGQCHIRVDCLVSRICVRGVNRFVIYLGVIRFTHLKTRVAFLCLTLSENESQFILENISADGVKKARTLQDYPGSSFQTFVKNVGMIYVYRPPLTVQQ